MDRRNLKSMCCNVDVGLIVRTTEGEPKNPYICMRCRRSCTAYYPPEVQSRTLKVTNVDTGKHWTEVNTNHSWQDLALEICQSVKDCKIVYCDIEGLVEFNGCWYILDECGNWMYLPDNYNVEEVG